MKRFSSVLVANRGEIAVRVLRSAKQAGYRTVAVYSDADADALHVQLADTAVHIGPAAPAESYLSIDRILQAAQLSGAEAIHPGYGFLSENAAFARACLGAGLVFIGPSPEAIEAMGDKARAKRRMLEANVPCIPGFQDADASDDDLLAAAQRIGLPLMVKAAAGGGGKGMRLVTENTELAAALRSARSEARSAFGDDALILEQALIAPRHVEIQIMGDAAGNVIHLGERDCSIQRRHQKVVEESPCPVMTPALREAMGQSAVDAATAVSYQGAGTVEFLLDAQGQFYFLEMNTRLQVEHPVTEMVTGLDLVALQLDIAQGEPLPVTQADVTLDGHAIEVRLYAEDPAQDFLPAAGTASCWQAPAGEGIRVDHGLLPGQSISPSYDPMVAKIIAWGGDRETARQRLLQALENTVLFGFANNLDFLHSVIGNADFAAGVATTAFIDQHFPGGYITGPPIPEMTAIAALLQYRRDADIAATQRLQQSSQPGDWIGLSTLTRELSFADNSDTAFPVSIQAIADERYAVTVNDRTVELGWLGDTTAYAGRIAVDGMQKTVHWCFQADGELALQVAGRTAVLREQTRLAAQGRGAAGDGAVTAPMHGKLLEVLITRGDRVAVGDPLLIVEAMKMEHRVVAAISGEVTTVLVAAGSQVAAGDLLAEILPPD